MSQTAIFIVGIVVFALTVWGSVMAGGIWLGQIAEAEDARGAASGAGSPDRRAIEADNAPATHPTD